MAGTELQRVVDEDAALGVAWCRPQMSANARMMMDPDLLKTGLWLFAFSCSETQ